VAFAPKDKAISTGTIGRCHVGSVTPQSAGFFTGPHPTMCTAVLLTVTRPSSRRRAAFDLSIRCGSRNGKEVRTLTDHTKCMASVCFSPDGKRLLSARYYTTLRIWDVESGSGSEANPVPQAPRQLAPVFARTASASSSRRGGRRLSPSGTPRAQELRRYDANGTHRQTSVSFFPDGKRSPPPSWDRLRAHLLAPR